MSRRPIPQPHQRSTSHARALLWSAACEQALYGPGGFYHRPEGPAGHFRTSVHASPLFSEAMATLLVAVDRQLGHPQRIDFVDVGAGRGELLGQLLGWLASSVPTAHADLRGRIRWHAVERAERPIGLREDVSWSAELPEGVVGLVVANEWLDNIPLDIVEAHPDGIRRVLVQPGTGEEAPGGPIGLRDASWLNRWWPLAGADPGARAEVGFPRDDAWAAVIRGLTRGLAVACDYGHLRADRAAGAYADGTLVGYQRGRAVDPIPDGSCDLTSHVAIDACAAAGERTGAQETRLLRQRVALGGLGVVSGSPSVELARSNPAGYARALARSSQSAELVDPQGLGGFWWLVQSVDLALPDLLAGE